MVKLQEALKPHVKAGVLAGSQAYKHKAVGAGATDSGNTRKESKALVVVTRQNREMAKEIDQLKNARPERPSGGKGKGSKGKRNSSGSKGGKGNSNFTVTCAHPQCKGEHFLKECPKMQGLDRRIQKAIQTVHHCLWMRSGLGSTPTFFLYS